MLTPNITVFGVFLLTLGILPFFISSASWRGVALWRAHCRFIVLCRLVVHNCNEMKLLVMKVTVVAETNGGGSGGDVVN